AVHRVVAADAHQGHVDRTGLLGVERQVGEQGRVAEVVDRLASKFHYQPGRDVDGAFGGRGGVPRGDQLRRAPLQLDGATDVGVVHVLETIFAELIGDLDDRH